MEKKVKISVLHDKRNNGYFHISIYNRYNFKQYILQDNYIYTFFVIIHFLYKYGIVKIKKKKNVCL